MIQGNGRLIMTVESVLFLSSGPYGPESRCLSSRPSYAYDIFDIDGDIYHVVKKSEHHVLSSSGGESLLLGIPEPRQGRLYNSVFALPIATDFL